MATAVFALPGFAGKGFVYVCLVSSDLLEKRMLSVMLMLVGRGGAAAFFTQSVSIWRINLREESLVFSFLLVHLQR